MVTSGPHVNAGTCTGYTVLSMSQYAVAIAAHRHRVTQQRNKRVFLRSLLSLQRCL